mmetsp:Transcript_17197/g.55803  ORF Transcript_17197/g.55803 Transcript_17197/m.55803 type:complete len:153 (-) Transcript_17197:7-465(-)
MQRKPPARWRADFYRLRRDFVRRKPQRRASERRDGGDLGGSNLSVQLDGAPTSSAGFVAIACGTFHSVALRDDGTVVTWGSNGFHQRDGAPTSTGFVGISCAGNLSVALRSDATVVPWGDTSERDGAPTPPTSSQLRAARVSASLCATTGRW